MRTAARGRPEQAGSGDRRPRDGGVALVASEAVAQDVGRVKTVKGTVYIEREGRRELALVGTGVRQADIVVTGPDGAVGVTLADDTLLSAGPNSILAIERFVYEANQPGSLEATLSKGTLAVVSGRIAKQAPDAMRVKTPAAILGVRGTEFVVRAATARRKGGRRFLLAGLLWPARSRRRARAAPAAARSASRSAGPRRSRRAPSRPRREGGRGRRPGGRARGRAQHRVRDRPDRRRRPARARPSVPGPGPRRLRRRARGEPPRPITFVLYFVEATDQFTPESQALVDQVLVAIASRPAPRAHGGRPHRRRRHGPVQRRAIPPPRRARAGAPDPRGIAPDSIRASGAASASRECRRPTGSPSRAIGGSRSRFADLSVGGLDLVRRAEPLDGEEGDVVGRLEGLPEGPDRAHQIRDQPRRLAVGRGARGVVASDVTRLVPNRPPPGSSASVTPSVTISTVSPERSCATAVS